MGRGRRGLFEAAWPALRYEEETLLAGKAEPAPDELPSLSPLEAVAGELRVMACQPVSTCDVSPQAVRKSGMLSNRSWRSAARDRWSGWQDR